MFTLFKNWWKNLTHHEPVRPPCPFAGTEDGLCPKYMTAGDGYLLRWHNLHRCCQWRMNKAKMSFALVHGTLENCSCSPELRKEMIKNLERYKKEHPEEYKIVFGPNEEIGYKGSID